MPLDKQLFSFLFSFLFGIGFYILLEVSYKLIYNSNLFWKIISSFILVIVSSLMYYVGLYKINYGVIHIYFLLVLFVSYFLTKLIHYKLIVKKKVLWYNLTW